MESILPLSQQHARFEYQIAIAERSCRNAAQLADSLGLEGHAFDLEDVAMWLGALLSDAIQLGPGVRRKKSHKQPRAPERTQLGAFPPVATEG